MKYATKAQLYKVGDAVRNAHDTTQALCERLADSIGEEDTVTDEYDDLLSLQVALAELSSRFSHLWGTKI